MDTIRLTALAARPRGWAPIEGPVQIRVVLNFQKKKQKGATWHTARPDWDNCAKIFCDALIGLAYVDDAQIAAAYVSKAVSKDEPFAQVTVEDLEP